VNAKTDEINKLINDIPTTNPNNVEFGEESNEQLYFFDEKFPKSFIIAFDNSNEDSQQLIIEELETPIHDMIDLPLIYQRINSVKEKVYATGKILEAIKVAGGKLNIDVTK
jgi:hypothetical protein